MAFALVFNILLFIALPLLLTNFLFIHFGWGDAPRLNIDRAAMSGAPWYYEIWMWIQAYMKPVRPSVAFNLVDGVIRMIFRRNDLQLLAAERHQARLRISRR